MPRARRLGLLISALAFARPEARVLRLPTLEDVRLPFEVNYNMIIEFYTR